LIEVGAQPVKATLTESGYMISQQSQLVKCQTEFHRLKEKFANFVPVNFHGKQKGCDIQIKNASRIMVVKVLYLF